jgi:hypothetical protein
MALILLAAAANAVTAQEDEEARQAYFGAVADFFELPRSEISILGDWRLPPDEIPVVLFVAGRAGVSAEALTALRRSGTSWHNLAARYRVDAGAFHIPLRESAQAGRLANAFARYRALPPARWSEIRLSDADIVALVNVRLLSEVLGISLEDVLRRAGEGESFVAVYARMVRGAFS